LFGQPFEGFSCAQPRLRNPMSGIRRPRPSGFLAFWNLFDSIERLSGLELEAVRSRDYGTMDTLYEQKKADFERLHSLGRRLGINRQHPELSRRLAALERLQALIVDAARCEASAMHGEWREAEAENQRLRSLRRAYASDPTIPDFNAEG